MASVFGRGGGMNEDLIEIKKKLDQRQININLAIEKQNKKDTVFIWSFVFGTAIVVFIICYI